MVENVSDIQNGMDVYGSDGQKIGSINDVIEGGSGATSGTTWQPGTGGLDVETVNRGDTTYRDPTASGADYTDTGGTETSFRDPTARGADYGNTTAPGSTYTDPTLPTRGTTGGAGLNTGVSSDMGEPIGTSGNEGAGGTPDFSTTPGSSDYAGTGTSSFAGTGTTDFAGVVETTTVSGTSPYGTPSGVGTATATSTGYFKVKEGGLLGIGGTDLYIPFSAVTNIVPGDSVTIDCTKDEAASRYGQEPGVANNDTPPLT